MHPQQYTGAMHVHAAPEGRTGAILRIALVLTLGYILLTLAAGLRAHSLALLSEAGHNTSDFLALALSWIAVRLHAKPADERKTFGYRRAGVLAAFVNSLALVGIAAWLAFAAIHRLMHPVTVHPRIMMIVAAVGVVMNGAIAWMLWRAGRDVNLRAVFVHMLGDTLSTAAVIAGGAAIAWTGIQRIDPILSLLIAAMIFWSSLSIIRETLNILLEGMPAHLELAELRTAMQQVPGVCGVHDLHVWSLGSQVNALACHVTIPDIPLSESRRILALMNGELLRRFRIQHTTIQFEQKDSAGCGMEDGCLSAIECEAVIGHHHAHSHSHGH
jgi:cobalt-zinc-cadmium efflux system protein